MENLIKFQPQFPPVIKANRIRIKKSIARTPVVTLLFQFSKKGNQYEHKIFIQIFACASERFTYVCTYTRLHFVILHIYTRLMSHVCVHRNTNDISNTR
jgi:hypothetical protein